MVVAETQRKTRDNRKFEKILLGNLGISFLFRIVAGIKRRRTGVGDQAEAAATAASAAANASPARLKLFSALQTGDVLAILSDESFSAASGEEAATLCASAAAAVNSDRNPQTYGLLLKGGAVERVILEIDRSSHDNSQASRKRKLTRSRHSDETCP